MTHAPTYKYILKGPTGRGTFSYTQIAAIAGGGNKLLADFQKPVIVKTLDPQLRDRPNFEGLKHQFEELASRLSRCQHPHLAPVVEVFEEERQPYIVYDAIAGISLAEILETEGALPESLAIHYIQQIAAALRVLHDADLKHLDINPRNIIQREDRDEVVLVEFGLTCELTPEIKQTHANLLSWGYAAPEQHQPEGCSTPATDIYALAATLYTLLAGSPPPPAPLLDRVPPETWQQFPPALSPPIKRAILRGLELDPAQRPQTVDAWLALLTPVDSTPEPEALTESSPSPAPAMQDAAPLPDPWLSEPEEPPSPTAENTTPGESETVSLDLQSNSTLLQQKTQGTQSERDLSQPTKATPHPKFPLRALLLTCAIAASAGAGFGLSVRFNRPEGAGSSIWHLKQSFPPDNEESLD